MGPSGLSREKVTVSVSKECSSLAANKEVSKKKERENEKTYQQWYTTSHLTHPM